MTATLRKCSALLTLVALTASARADDIKILTNHLGYELDAPKHAILLAHDGDDITAFRVLTYPANTEVLTGHPEKVGPCDQWKNWVFWTADASPLHTEGTYTLEVTTNHGRGGTIRSFPFLIQSGLLERNTLSNVIYYFKGQRASGLLDKADHNLKFDGQTTTADVHGGWYDASGDCSKYLSHLSYANFMNPQQTPLVTWTLLAGRDRIPPQSKWLDERIVDEALHGADFLVRMQAPEGFFYVTVFDKWSKDEHQREICSYATQKGIKSADYQAGFRQGGGMAIAALARASGAHRDGEFTREQYLAAAIRGFELLEARNAEFLDDHEDNLIDDYCALLAASELFARTGDARWRDAGAARARAIVDQQDASGFWWCDRARTRSFFHASDAGLPYLALMRFLDCEPEPALVVQIRATLPRGLRFELAITQSVANPLGYPRQYVALPGRERATQFFVPHDNESGYWWQGENARLASLATAARAAQSLHLADAAFDAALAEYAQRALDWLFGANPFDTCMLQGWGHNPPRYEPGFW
ncbi:MAG TPA: glycoside hydrolase family 9 protein, partial [Chloroflexota bacterium]